MNEATPRDTAVVGRGLIVVGLDDSDQGRTALEFALHEGLARGATVEVVTTWNWALGEDAIALTPNADDARAAALAFQEHTVREAVDRLETRPEVSQTIVHGYAGPALVARSVGADMLIVGSGRKGVISRTFLGSVSEHCVRHAHCPVLVVPDPDRFSRRPAADVAAAPTTAPTAAV